MIVISFLGIFTSLLSLVLMVEVIPVISKSKTAKYLNDATGLPNEVRLPGWRKLLIPLEKPVSAYSPSGLFRKTVSNLYWAQFDGKWLGWSAIQLLSMRIAAFFLGFLVGGLFFETLVLAFISGLVAYQLPVTTLNNSSRKTRRHFQRELPEFIQLFAAQMAAGVSMEEALRRSSQSEGLVARWMQQMLNKAQGRSILMQLKKEASASCLPDLISMATQLGFIRRGTAQQALLTQLADRIAADYVAQADQRAEKISGELVIPMVLFYFLPFLVSLIAIIGYPVVEGLL